MKKVLAFDLGASSGRGILATLDNGKIHMEEVHRFANNGVNVRGTLYWDVLYLFDQIKQGITKAKLAGGFDSIGIDTWGVDFGLIDKSGDLIGNPVTYRDARTDTMIDEASEVLCIEEIYKKTGIQIMNFNTLFQLYYLVKYKKEMLDKTEKFLFMPDLLNYFLTGVKKSEYTIASTSQLINPYDKVWDFELAEKFGISKDIFCDIIKTGDVVGKLTDDICEELGIEPVNVVAVGEHDTASAVVSVPSLEDEFVYISCGTWSLFGTELKNPVITEETFKSSYTNEGAYGYNIKFLTNIMGLWLIQESRRAWAKQGKELSFNDLEQEARKCEPFKCFIDPDYHEFAKPGNLPKRIQEYCERTNQYVPQTVGEIVRCIYESLALKYCHAFTNLKNITKKDFKSIHIVGGGTKDPFLCQMTSNACDVLVTAGPIEATALGNIAVQFMALGEIKGIKEARKIIKDSADVKAYTPCDTDAWKNAYNKYIEIIK